MCDQRDFIKWKRRTARSLPTLAARVFALRGKLYPGCGGHYDMERRLGAVMMRFNDYNSAQDVSDRITMELAAEELYRDVALAERSIIDGQSTPPKDS